MTQLQTKKKNKKPVLLKKNTKVFDFSTFDPATGEKIANSSIQSLNEESKKNALLARMEAASEARGKRTSPISTEESIKDALTGGSAAFLVGNALIGKDSSRVKWLTAARKKGLLGLGAAALAAGMSVRKQKSEYNKQQGARELLAGKKTNRAEAYREYLASKYGEV